MNIYSPDDCFVVSIASEGMAPSGAELVKLLSPNLDKALERLNTFSSERDIAARKLRDGRRSALKALNVTLLAQLQLQVTSAQALVDSEQHKVDVGLASEDGLHAARLRLSGATISLLKHQQVLADFDADTADLIDRADVLKKHFQAEQARLSDLRRRLSVLAPTKGSFKPLTAPGLFLQEGELIGTFEAQ